MISETTFPRTNDFYNLSKPELVEHSVIRQEGCLSETGSLVTNTKKYTGRSPNDKFTVYDDNTKDKIWFCDSNKKMLPEDALKLFHKIENYLKQKNCYVVDAMAGANKNHGIKIRLVLERAWHALFAQNMFIDLESSDIEKPIDFTIYHAPGFLADKLVDKTNSEVAVVLDLSNKRIFICGTEYAGEIKKSVFTLLNYLLPNKGVLGMHCSANKNKDGQVALFFGLSGTGKTTLSAEKSRDLIGDDEHGWDESGIFNFEGGCYAKVIKLSPKDEPEIYHASQQFTAILENVQFEKNSRKINLDDDSKTENTRASYDLSFIPHAVLDKTGSHPEHIFMLTCDAFGVLPPIAKLTADAATYHFINGYTAKVAGTERGVKEPKAVFSACFGAPFMAHFPYVYAKILSEKIKRHNVQCWLLNTGWTGGPYGVGERIKIAWSRALIAEALSGNLSKNDFYLDERFNLLVPKFANNVPREIFYPKDTWKDKKAYEIQAEKLARLFHENFNQYEQTVSDAVKNSAPKI